MVVKKSTNVPKAFENDYARMIAITDDFCEKHLNHEYSELARYAVAGLYRKRPTPLASGKPQTWACAILYALGQVNYLSDKSTSPYMTMADLSGLFGVGSSTAGNKAKTVREALKMHQLTHDWMLPSLVAENDTVWRISFNGLIVDARELPIEVQEEAYARGLIPYVE
jgi:hypothetical protein